MYLAKFFHRTPGDGDRELLLIPGGAPIIMGIHMEEHLESRREDFLREEFSGMAEAVAAYRRQADQLVAAGYTETTHTEYTLRNLLPDPQAKPAWQKGLDELMLAALSAPLAEQERQLAALENTPAAREPLYLWLAAHRAYAAQADNAKTIRLAEQARDTLASRRAGKVPHYAWSIDEHDLKARIFEVLSWACLRAGEPAAALEAIEQAREVAPSQDRGAQLATILCDHFPERQDEAFADAFKYGEFGGYEAITALPAYAEYLARRKRKSKSGKGWRWSTKKPADKADLDSAEARLGPACLTTIAISSASSERANSRSGCRSIPTNFAFLPQRSWASSATICSTISRSPRRIRKRYPPGSAGNTASRRAISCRSPNRSRKAVGS